MNRRTFFAVLLAPSAAAVGCKVSPAVAKSQVVLWVHEQFAKPIGTNPWVDIQWRVAVDEPPITHFQRGHR